MKKLYFFLASLLALVGIGVSNALITTVVDQGYIPVDEIGEGKNFVIGINISSYNGNPVTFWDNNMYDFLWDDNGSEEENANFMPQSRKASTAVDGHFVWTLEKAEADAKGQWYYIKNVETGRYWSYDLKDNCDPSDLASLGEEDENEDIQWWAEGDLANCNIKIFLVADKANAKTFIFKKPSEGAPLLRPDVTDFSNLQHMFDALDASRTMIITRLTVAGKDYYACANSDYGGGFSRYHDWAGYWALIETTVEDDPITELEYYLNTMISEYPVGIHPGCVEQTEEAEAYNAAVAAIRDEMDNASSYDADHWRARIADLKALEETAKSFTYRPVGAGFIRIQCLRGGNYAQFNASGNGSCGALDLESKNQIWQVTVEEGKTYLRNIATFHYMPEITANSQNVNGTFKKNPTTFTCCNTLVDADTRLSHAPFNIHIGNYLHSQGGNLLTWWDAASSGDRWLIYAVTEEELAETFGAEFLDQIELRAKMTTLLNDAEDALNDSKTSGLDCLIDGVGSISSPKSQAGEGTIAALLDNNYNTYWHSEWSSGDVSADNSLHYLQFALNQSVSEVEMRYARRSGVYNDHPTHFVIYGGNSADGDFVQVADFAVTTEVVEREVTDEESGETTTVTEEVEGSGVDKVTYHYTVNLGAEYSFLRVRASMTDYWRGYWHASEMTFYKAGGVDLFAKTGEVGVALEEAVATAKGLTDVITADDYDALKAAYDAFIATYTNPAALRAAIAEGNEQLRTIEVGNQPGQVSQEAWDALNAAVTAAQTWLNNKLATCTNAELDAQLQALLEALDAWYNQGVQNIQTGVWYHIAYANARDLNKATPYCEAGTQMKGGRIACGYADISELDDFGGPKAGQSHIYLVTTTMFGGEVADYEYVDEMAQWRFIDAGDGTYAIQNRATGLFMPAANVSTEQLSAKLMPGRYTVNSLGDGTFEFGVPYGVNEDGEVKLTYLNIARPGYICSYFVGGANDDGSVWKLTVADVVEDDYVQSVNIVNNGAALRGLTLPYALNIEDMEGDAQFFTDVQGIDDETLEVGLNETFDEIPAGTPFFVFNTGTSEEADVPNVAKVPMSSDVLTWEVDNSGVIVGALDFDGIVYKGSLEAGSIATEGNMTEGAFTTVKNNKASVAGAAWIDIHNNPDILGTEISGADEIFVIDGKTGDIFDAIEIVKGENGKTNVIYNMSGQRVSAAVKGLVIINGKKMIVK